MIKVLDGFYIWNKGDNDRLSDNFSTKEFSCKCNYSDCKEQKVAIKLISDLQELRNYINTAIEINSAFRCSKHQQDVRESGVKTASGVSSHEQGLAADIRCPSLRTDELFKIMDNRWDNLGLAKTFIHCDIRPLVNGVKRRWTY